MPDIFYDTLDLVPDGLKEFAKEADGKVAVSVVAKSKLDEFRDNNIKVVKERDDMAAALTKAKTILGTEDFDAAAATLTELRTVAQRVKDGELVANTSLDDALKQRTEQMRQSYETEVQTKAKEAAEWRNKFSQTDTKLRQTYIDRAVTDVVLDESIGVHPKAVRDILGRAYDVYSVSDDGKLTPKRGEAVLYGADGVTPMSPKEWVLSLREEAPYFFKGSNGGGSSGADGQTINGMTAAEIAKLPPEQRLAIANGEYKKR